MRRLKELGFTLRDIALLLSERDQSALDAVHMQAMAATQLAAIDARMARLVPVRRYIAAVAAGDLALLQIDAACRFLLVSMAAAPIAQSMPPTAPTVPTPPAPITPLASWAESAS